MRDFEQIYQAYFQDVFFYVRSLSHCDSTAEDIAAETFFKAMKKVGGFDGRCDIRTWLYQIAKNSYYSHLRKNKRQADFALSDNVASDCHIESAFEDRETASIIHKFLHQMDEPYKEVFTLRVFAELSHSQIAELFGKTDSWARVTYHRAKAKILSMMEGRL